MKTILVTIFLLFPTTVLAETAREKFEKDWAKYVPVPASIVGGNTLVVWVKNKRNNFRNPDEYAQQYHPKYLNGQTCRELGLQFIQVRNKQLDKMLSGIVCKD